jgi:hypothetical protein
MLTGASPPISWWIFIPLVTWVSFTWDHLLDVFKNKNTLITHRHLLHKNYFKIILIICVLLTLISIYIGIITFDIRYAGFISLFSLCFPLHLLLCRFKKLSFAKEISVGLLYTLMIWSYPINLNHSDLSLILFGGCLFFILTLINLYWLSYIEYTDDKKQGFFGIGSLITNSTIFNLIVLLNTLFLISLLVFSVKFNIKIGVLFFVMWVMLSGVLVIDKNGSIEKYYRHYNDWVFILPYLVFIFLNFI